MTFQIEPACQHGAQRHTGVLLVNLGTPDDPSPAAVRRYLAEFLSDPRVVEITRLVWWPILHGLILNLRPAKTARKYQSIWMPEGSPLRVYTERQAQLLRGFLGEHLRSPLVVRYAMRYGNPSLAAVLSEMHSLYCDRLLIMPLYPQYASSTTGTVMDAIGAILKRRRHVPGIRFVRSFHDHPAYIDAIVKNMLAWWMKSGRPDFSRDKLLMSFHGLPQFHLDKGDPYHCECQKSARLIAAQLGLDAGQYVVTFQSRFGRGEWLKPATGATLAALGKSGVRRVDVVCPGFASDCLETLEEIAIESREIFMHAGGREFNYIPTANDSEPWIQALKQIALDNLQGWASESWDRERAAFELKASAQRAREMGAKK